MTVSLGPLLTAALLLLGAGDLARRRPDARQARATATAWAATGLVVLVACVPLAGLVDHALVHNGHPTITTLATGWAHWTPMATELAGLVAVALAPLRSHTPSTFAQILVVLATGLAATATTEPSVIVTLWGLASAATWRELRHLLGPRGPARLFALHQLLGLSLAALGVTILALGGGTAWPGTIGTAALLAATTARLGLLPLHLWVSGLIESAPMGLAVVFLTAPTAPILLLTDGIPKPGAGLVMTGAATALLSALLGLVQPDARRGLSAVAISVSGIVACGLADASTTTVAGAMLTWQAYAIAMAGALMVLSATEARRGPITLTTAGGSFARTPKLAAAFLLLGLAVAGFPTTLGFAGEDLLVEGTRESSPLLMVALIVGTAANGATVIRWFFAGYTGRREHLGERDLTTREVWAITAVLTALLLGGLAPGRLVPNGPAPHLGPRTAGGALDTAPASRRNAPSGGQPRRGGGGRSGRLAGLAGAGTLGVGGWLGGHLTCASGVGVDTTAFQAGPDDWTDAGPANGITDTLRSVDVAGVPVLVFGACERGKGGGGRHSTPRNP
jgi:formate hydrogenlyase subunit 3/multisubunit Na+/H+ antiporter MnhD subunit